MAIHLDDCMRAFGQMHHAKKEEGMVAMPTAKCSELVNRSWKTLPAGWKWRKD